MRIAGIEAIPVAVPLAEEFHWAGGVQSGANFVVFAVRTDDGVVGYGESIAEAPAAVAEFGRLMSRHFEGRSVDEIEAALHEVWSGGRWRFTPQFTQFVVSGIEAACWDALGKTLAVPTSTLFGGRVRETIDFFGFLQGDDAEVLANHARRLAGHTVLYVKVGRPSFADDEAIVAAIRDAVGSKPLLRVDPNEAWDAATAIERIRLLEPYGLDWVEQPVASWDVAGLADVRNRVDVKVAADQAVATMRQLRQVLEARAADVIVQGPHDAGGLLRFRQQATVAGAWGIAVNVHAFMQSEISFLAHVQVASTVPNLTTGNQMMHQLLAERLVEDEIPIRDGTIAVPSRPGHGFTVDQAALNKAHERFQRDGAYTTFRTSPR